MTAIFLLQICFISACSRTLLYDHQRHLNSYKAVVAKRTNNAHSSAVWRQRHTRRPITASPSHSSPKRRRAYTTAADRQSLHEASTAHFARAEMQSTHEIIRRRASVVERPPADPPATTTTTAFTPQPAVTPRSSYFKPSEAQLETLIGEMETLEAVTPPPPTPSTQERFSRASRSESNASRNTNRLSLTLPIAPPTSDPSRPASVATTSYPPTPVDSSTITSPSDPNDFIIAIAAQERRVLEIREELARAEGELTRLKQQWTIQGGQRKREIRNEPMRPLAPQFEPSLLDDDEAGLKRSVELDRRKSLLRDLQGQTGPREYRRRVLRGGHTRTLSLLSPTKPEGFAVHEDTASLKSPEIRSPPMLSHAALSKRASWQPRSYNTAVPPVAKQMAQDFKLGLWSFVEDIRQATVGDEPINGGRSGSTDPHGRRSYAADQDTIKANSSSRTRVPVNSAFDLPPMDTPSKPSKALQERPNPKPATKSTTTKAKHFSWTPLTFDSFDDNDWSNWDSPQPSSAKPARWSGSTVGGAEDLASMAETNDENVTPLKKKSSITIDTSAARPEPRPESALLSPARLEELLPTVVNKLSPGNLKRTANNLMDEWEKSLKETDQEEQLIDFKETTA
ncbi:uncharacterized protein CCOS01_00724 [Colletotrichum costaricense]|uniref:DUF4048 domain-containing protein n=1 Tax=Colletotrichum costaricense TaxID=1209916 RepID=A0AAI9ZBJ5_9PEZI|nr:uncharacterized protein CCOS01_00724 [Colletotrichum costaricense]KAK1539410.1 hypothetical protein CCOS01_00724 [Colletotrichum costaricense]